MINLVDLSSLIPDILLDLRYSSTNNVCGKQISNMQVAMLKYEAAKALQEAAVQLKKQGFDILVWDAYRTKETQHELRKISDQEKYVSKVSHHSKGIAIDLTLLDYKGLKLDMGCDFDYFTKKASENYPGLTDTQKANRKLLRVVMESAGFTQLKSEWWHYDFLN